MRPLIAFALLAASSTALAQSAAVQPLKDAENAARRGQTACSKNQTAKCETEIDNVIRYGNAARAAAFPTPTPSPSPSPSPTPTPTPTPPVSGYVPSPSLKGGPDLVATFPVSEGLVPSWGTGQIPGLYGGNEGAFRLTCGIGHTNYDDALFWPGQPGKAHLHQYWGPTTVNAFTTPATLATTIGNSTCNYGSKTLNRSSYWAPALLDDAGFMRNADWVAVYYKRAMPNAPACTPGSSTFKGNCVGLPNQIRYIFGWDQTKPAELGQGASWYCTGGTGGHFRDLDAVFASGCKAGDTLVADMAAPDCWDGKFLDTPDHRSHTAYSDYSNGFGYAKCPATHPYVIPQNESKIAWTVTADMYATVNGVVRSRLHLSSDHMRPGGKPGETLHSDYMEQWVEQVKRMWLDNCINKGLDCSGGDLGNGQQLIGASRPSYGWTNPTPRAPIPPSPVS